jgi:hypothetical protein
VLAKQDASLLGCWTTAPIPEDFTFGIELELVLHSAHTGRQGVQMAHSPAWYSSVRVLEAEQSIKNYLVRMGISEGWK